MPFNCCPPDTTFDPVHLQEELVTDVGERNCHRELFTQMALEVIYNIPDLDIIIYAGGTRSDPGTTRSAIYSNISDADISCSIRNINNFSNFM